MIGVNCHLMYNNLYYTINLANWDFTVEHTTDNVIHCIKEILLNFYSNLESKQITLLTDNAKEMMAIGNRTNWNWIGCVPHRLILILKHACTWFYGNVIKDMNHIVGYIRRNEQIHREYQFLSTKLLHFYTPTRFHSIVALVESFLINSVRISDLVGHLEGINMSSDSVLLEMQRFGKLFRGAIKKKERKEDLLT
eukprot:NODE_591_length_5620_cov_0.949828.p2 type:complete len:195 gc:universal NODE_591_length_5620_cov_0.949828:1047-463(-)